MSCGRPARCRHPVVRGSSKQCTTFNGMPRSDACRNANSITGSDSGVPSAPTTTAVLAKRSVVGRQTTTGHAACLATAALTEPSSALRRTPWP